MRILPDLTSSAGIRSISLAANVNPSGNGPTATGELQVRSRTFKRYRIGSTRNSPNSMAKAVQVATSPDGTELAY